MLWALPRYLPCSMHPTGGYRGALLERSGAETSTATEVGAAQHWSSGGEAAMEERAGLAGRGR